MSFEDYVAALEARETITELVRQTINEMHPPYRYAQTVSWDKYERTCWVQYPEGGDPVMINMGALQPTAVGQVVRVAGDLGDRYLADVIGPAVMITNEVELGAQGARRTTNFVPGTLNQYHKIQFNDIMHPFPETNNWDFVNHQYQCPQDGVYHCSGMIRAFNLGFVGQVDWATTLFVDGNATYRLDEFLQPYPGNVPIELRLDFSAPFFVGQILDFRFYNGLAPATLQCDTAQGELFCYFRIDLDRVFI